MGSRSRQSAKHWGLPGRSNIEADPTDLSRSRGHLDADTASPAYVLMAMSQLLMLECLTPNCASGHLFVLRQGKVLVAVCCTPFQPHFRSDQPYPCPTRSPSWLVPGGVSRNRRVLIPGGDGRLVWWTLLPRYKLENATLDLLCGRPATNTTDLHDSSQRPTRHRAAPEPHYRPPAKQPGLHTIGV
jgi:hypothetical protein